MSFAQPRLREENDGLYLATLTELAIPNQELPIAGVEALAKAIRYNMTARTINLCAINLEDAGIIVLAEALEKNHAVETLILSDNNIGDLGARAIAQLMEKNETIKSINLSDNNINDAGAMAIITAFATNQTIFIDCARNHISPDTMNSLLYAPANFQAIHSLKVGDSIITQPDVTRLSLPCLVDAQINLLVKALERSQKSVSLELRNNSLTRQGVRALLSAARKNIYITDMDLDNSIRPEDEKALNNALAFNKLLADLHTNDPSVNKLNLGTRELDDQHIAALATALSQNEIVEVVDLSHNKISDTGLVSLATMLESNKKIKNLTLAKNNLYNSGVVALASALEKNKTLMELDLSINKIGQVGTAALAKVLKQEQNLEVLKLNGNKIYAGVEDLALALEKNHSLKELNLTSTGLQAHHIGHLAKALWSNQALEKLILVNNNVKDEGCALLSTALARNTKLKHLDLGQNEIKNDGIKILICGLNQNSTLLDLALVNNGIPINSRHWSHLKKLLNDNYTGRPHTNNTENTHSSNSSKSAMHTSRWPNSRLRMAGSHSAAPLNSSSGNHGTAESHSNSNKTMQTQRYINSIPYADITLCDEIGRGGFGKVYKGFWQNSEVAIKELTAFSLTEEAMDEFKRESQMMGKLRHPNIITLWGISIDRPGHLSMVMELMPEKSNLYEVLHSSITLDWSLLYQIAKDVLAGLKFIHSENILHRDLKSPNVLLGFGLRAKITDFGLAKVKSQTQSTSTQAGTNAGTPAWMAPEQFSLNGRLSEKTDIFSFGMILWELSSRKTPFANARGNYNLIAKGVEGGQRESIPANTPIAFSQLIEWCWKQNPAERPRAEEAMARLQEIAP